MRLVWVDRSDLPKVQDSLQHLQEHRQKLRGHMSEHKGKHFLKDEGGGWSAMRILLYVNYIQLSIMGWVTAATTLSFPAAAWTIFGASASILTVGCFGPRIAQYLGPQLGSIVGSIQKSVQERREQGGDHEVTQ